MAQLCSLEFGTATKKSPDRSGEFETNLIV